MAHNSDSEEINSYSLCWLSIVEINEWETFINKGKIYSSKQDIWYTVLYICIFFFSVGLNSVWLFIEDCLWKRWHATSTWDTSRQFIIFQSFKMDIICIAYYQCLI